MTIDMSQFYQVFFEEAAEHLAQMESLLLELDVETADKEMLNAIFRAAHSIKGGAGTFGFSDMAQVTHVLETLLDRLRKQELKPTTAMVDAFLDAGDVLKAQLAAHQEGDTFEDPSIAQVCAVLQQLAHGDAASPLAVTPPPPPPPVARTKPEVAADSAGAGPVDHDEGETAPVCWRIEIDRNLAGEALATSLDGLVEVLSEKGTLEQLSGEEETTLCWHLTTAVDRSEILDTLDFVCDEAAVKLVPVASVPADDTETGEDPGYGFFAPPTEEPVASNDENDEGYGFFTDAPGATQAMDQEHPGYGLYGGAPGMEQVAAQVARQQQEADQGFGFFEDAPGGPASEQAPSSGAAPPVNVPPAGGGPRQPPPRRPPAGDTSIRVSVEKVDQLINLVGELVITHAMMAESISMLDPVTHQSIFNGLSNLERNSRDLQQAVMSIRMMPISFVFNRFPRVVRDTASALSKKVNLKLMGEDTELDKGLIERLADPLNHLVRNSIDHGIESPAQRQAAGKPEAGQIVLRASHQGGNIVVEVSDDGAGLNREKLLAKAMEKGVPLPENPSNKDVWHLIFAPGFSTADTVTDISGRGVGMDVVRRNIEEMNGRVEIDSELGQGTRIVIRLPLTLAILDGMSVRMHDEIFILPLTAIRESVRPRREQVKTVSGKGRVFQVGEEYLPLVELRRIFSQDAAHLPVEDGIVVIVDTGEGRAALLVDELMAQHQVVIKSLETNYRKVDGVSGATIMGDGRVALILDVDELMKINRRLNPSTAPTMVQESGT
ncbi:two-component system, chemotaxis family, sensor kinase CheA [Ectothiorhodospira magna]|uniref:Chemotaxis protein CheA n=1 Tax=Ectothiorhodospira magna TaxID=867345 RepID=A0A1H9A799_9GAMM|nr:chemotaxis protein CheW [Ectothiorhodospira magna]SEP72560.1 two-component system, chemotaxis family, sensor kinase CheA [Ectothiorhodospira magna]